MSDPFTQDPETTEEPEPTTNPDSPLTPPPVDPDLPGQPDDDANTSGVGSGNVEADTASGGSPEP